MLKSSNLILSKKLNYQQTKKQLHNNRLHLIAKRLKKIPCFTLKYVKEIVFFRQIYFVIQKLGYNIARYTVVA